MPLPNITTPDLTRALDDCLRVGEQDLDDLRDARRAATVLSAEDCKTALLEALRERALSIREQYS